MQHLIRNNSPYTVIIIFVFALIVKMQALMHPQLPVIPPGHILYSYIVRIFDFVINGSAFGYTMLTVIMLFTQALYLNNVAYKYKLFGKPTYVIAFLYILLTSLSPEFSYFSVMLMLNWCLIALIDILLGFHQTSQPRKHIFNGGFVLGVSAILHFPAIAYLILLFIAFSLLRSFNAGEWVVGLLGFVTPIYFFAAALFLTDTLPAIKEWPQVGLSFQKMGSTLYMSGTIAGLVILWGCGMFILQGHLSRVSVFMRRNWIILIACLVISVFVAIGTPVSMRSEWLAIMLPLSLIIAHPFYLEKSKVFSNFVFYFSLALLVFCQFTF